MKASTEAAEIATRWFAEVWNDRNPTLAAELMTPDAIGHLEGPVPEIVGAADFARFQEAILSAMPDIRVDVLKCVSEGTDVAVLWQASSHGGSVTFRGTTWFRVVNGRIAEAWDCWNQAEVTTRLAALAP